MKFQTVFLLALGAFASTAVNSAETNGSFVSKSRDALPSFPSIVPGFYHEAGKDFWGQSFQEKGIIRLFEGDDWSGIPDFPSTSNGCGNGRFMVRWRSANPDVIVKAGISFGGTSASSIKEGSQGCIVGSNCHGPVFKFSRAKNRNESNLVDIYYEVRFWRA